MRSKSIYKLIVYALAMLTLSAGAALGWQLTQAFTYHGATGQPVTVAWQPDAGAASYEVQLYHQDHQQVARELTTDETQAILAAFALAYYVRYELQLLHEDHHRVAQALETDGTEGTLTPPRSGRYRVRVRSIAPAGTRSDWYFSTDAGAARVAGQPMGWQLFAWLAPASSPELE